jgi:hypothetical protein
MATLVSQISHFCNKCFTSEKRSKTAQVHRSIRGFSRLLAATTKGVKQTGAQSQTECDRGHLRLELVTALLFTLSGLLAGYRDRRNVGLSYFLVKRR